MIKASYSSGVKKELLEVIPRPRHCRIAELAGIYSVLGDTEADTACSSEKPVNCRINGESGLNNKCFTLLQKTNILVGYDFGTGTLSGKAAEEFLSMIKWDTDSPTVVEPVLLQQPCCKRAYLRGVFLSSGSITDPYKRYHLEIVARSDEQADQILRIMDTFSISGKLTRRNERPVIYIKESDQISDMLSVMEAPRAMMEFENVRVQKDIQNTVNRKVNCETANIGKMVDAAVRELNDIKLIEETRGLKSLSPRLRETAEIRLLHPEASLKELGELFDPPIGKSGVNHRLRRITEIATDIRNQEELQ
jgi:DNA-binding transcriptional regulator WhiA